MHRFYPHSGNRAYELAKAAVLRATAPFRDPASGRRWMRIACQIIDKYATDLTPRQRRAARLFVSIISSPSTWRLDHAMRAARGRYGFHRDTGEHGLDHTLDYFGKYGPKEPKCDDMWGRGYARMVERMAAWPVYEQGSRPRWRPPVRDKPA